ncbi:hypothetical protein JOQ06_011203, partial [Pogonophryne albipinna]
MRRQKHLTVEEVHELIFNRVMEEKSTDEEDSGSEEEETHEEVIDGAPWILHQLVFPPGGRRKSLTGDVPHAGAERQEYTSPESFIQREAYISATE